MQLKYALPLCLTLVAATSFWAVADTDPKPQQAADKPAVEANADKDAAKAKAKAEKDAAKAKADKDATSAAKPGTDAGDKPKPGAKQEPSVTQQASYIIGYSTGMNMRQRQGLGREDIDAQSLAKGIADALDGKQFELSQEEMQKVFMAFQEQVEARQKAKADANLKAGQAFLDGNTKKDGVKTTESGLQYQVLAEGTGATPKPTDEVRVHYRGSLIDGTVFESSYEGGRPAVFQVDEVIPGWTEALQLMKVGGKLRLFVPANLAYRDNPAGPGGANSVLIFEVELIGIVEEQP